MVLALVAIVPLALAGAVLLAIGLRGRLVSTHPHCRACGFDLAGLPPDPGEPRCPECGQPLSARRAVAPGRRRRRWVPLAAASACLLLAVGVAGAFAWAAATGYDWNTVKPVWWLELDAASSDPARAVPAGVELAARAINAELTPGQLDRTIEHALSAQASRPGAWAPELGDMFETLHMKGMISDETYGRYAAQGSVFEVLVRDRVPEDRCQAVWFVARGGTLSPGSAPYASAEIVAETIDGVPTPPGRFAIHALSAEISTTGSTRTSTELDPPLPPGEHRVVWTIDVKILPPGVRPWTPDADKTPLYTDRRELSAALHVLPVGEETVRFAAATPAQDAAMRAAFSEVTLAKRRGQIEYSLRYTGPRPFDAAMQIRLTVAGVELEPRDVVLLAGTGNGTTISMVELPPELADADRADVALVGSLDAAYDAPVTSEVWDGAVRFEGVPIEPETDP